MTLGELLVALASTSATMDDEIKIAHNGEFVDVEKLEQEVDGTIVIVNEDVAEAVETEETDDDEEEFDEAG